MMYFRVFSAEELLKRCTPPHSVAAAAAPHGPPGGHAQCQVYYNGTAERYWWNQNSDAVCVYVPVPEGFDPKTVEFTAKTKQLSLKFGGEEVRGRAPPVYAFPLFIFSFCSFGRCDLY